MINVCNPDYVKQVIEKHGFFNGRWHLVIQNPTKDNIMNYFQCIIPKKHFKDWTEAVKNLRLIGQSEFEDNQERI